MRCVAGAGEGLSPSTDKQKIRNDGTDAKNRVVGRGRGKLHPKQPTRCPYFLLLLQRTSFITVHNTLLGSVLGRAKDYTKARGGQGRL